MFGLVHGERSSAIAKRLADMIRANDYKLTTGFVGTRYLCHVLTNHGYHDVACRLVTQEAYPSWLYSIAQGATTIWERWDGIKPDGSFWSADMNSFNQYACGSVGDWLYRKLAGLDVMDGSAGYAHVLIHPRPGEPFHSAKHNFCPCAVQFNQNGVSIPSHS